MSVEEARARVMVTAFPPDGPIVEGVGSTYRWSTARRLEATALATAAALDRLILEVRAEMPCACEWFYDNIAVHWSTSWHVPTGCGGWGAIVLCPSCEARAELERIRVMAGALPGAVAAARESYDQWGRLTTEDG